MPSLYPTYPAQHTTKGGQEVVITSYNPALYPKGVGELYIGEIEGYTYVPEMNGGKGGYREGGSPRKPPSSPSTWDQLKPGVTGAAVYGTAQALLSPEKQKPFLEGIADLPGNIYESLTTLPKNIYNTADKAFDELADFVQNIYEPTYKVPTQTTTPRTPPPQQQVPGLETVEPTMPGTQPSTQPGGGGGISYDPSATPAVSPRPTPTSIGGAEVAPSQTQMPGDMGPSQRTPGLETTSAPTTAGTVEAIGGYAASAIGSYVGGVILQNSMQEQGNAPQGAVGGAAIGASMTGGNPYGIAIGAILGGALGQWAGTGKGGDQQHRDRVRSGLQALGLTETDERGSHHLTIFGTDFDIGDEKTNIPNASGEGTHKTFEIDKTDPLWEQRVRAMAPLARILSSAILLPHPGRKRYEDVLGMLTNAVASTGVDPNAAAKDMFQRIYKDEERGTVHEQALKDIDALTQAPVIIPGLGNQKAQQQNRLTEWDAVLAKDALNQLYDVGPDGVAGSGYIAPSMEDLMDQNPEAYASKDNVALEIITDREDLKHASEEERMVYEQLGITGWK